MKNIKALLLLLLVPGLLFAGKKEVQKIPVVARSEAKVDGVIAKGEYQSSFTDAKTGITVHWQADSANLYCALQSPGQGWLSIGLGSGGMNGAVMIIAYQTGEGAWAAEEHLGKAFFRHARAEKPRLIAARSGIVDGHTTMEFCLPLSLSNGKTINSAGELPYILAYHQDKPRLSKHSKKSSGLLVLTSGK
ncbi:MAG: DOMON domain-containing protein [bacterium]|nr:DOMON domain-containing protein [bacterium]